MKGMMALQVSALKVSALKVSEARGIGSLVMALLMTLSVGCIPMDLEGSLSADVTLPLEAETTPPEPGTPTATAPTDTATPTAPVLPTPTRTPDLNTPTPGIETPTPEGVTPSATVAPGTPTPLLDTPTPLLDTPTPPPTSTPAPTPTLTPTPTPAPTPTLTPTPTLAPTPTATVAPTPTESPLDLDLDLDGDGYTPNAGDCNDSDINISPLAQEVCDGKDNDCEGGIDEGVTTTYYQDGDKDGYGTPSVTTQACSVPSGFVSNNSDCRDTNDLVFPGATESCNGIDDDCDGLTDENGSTTWYRDADGDGFGNVSVTLKSCAQPSGYVADSTDCNDADVSIHPGAQDAFDDGRDSNCNGYQDRIYRVAGDGDAASTGDGGSALLAETNKPTGLAYDAAGNLYISEETGARIRKITPAGVISTFAGTGTAGTSADEIAATSAKLNKPHGMTFDSLGNLYFADRDNHRIRMIDTAGKIHAVAGSGTEGLSGDNGSALQAQLKQPTDVAFDAAGTLYIADKDNGRIRKVSGGIITTLAGSTPGYSGDGGSATAAKLNKPYGIDVDSDGNLWVAEGASCVIRIIDVVKKTIDTVAGTGVCGYSSGSGALDKAQFNEPSGIRFDVWGDLYIADKKNNMIRVLTLDGQLYTVAGDFAPDYSGDGGFSGDALLSGPRWPLGNARGDQLVISDKDNNRVRAIWW